LKDAGQIKLPIFSIIIRSRFFKGNWISHFTLGHLNASPPVIICTAGIPAAVTLSASMSLELSPSITAILK